MDNEFRDFPFALPPEFKSPQLKELWSRWQEDVLRIQGWFAEHRFQSNAESSLHVIMQYVTDLFDVTAGWNRFMEIWQTSHLQSVYLPHLKEIRDDLEGIALSHAEQHCAGDELEAYRIAVHARLESRFKYWAAEGVAYARQRERTVRLPDEVLTAETEAMRARTEKSPKATKRGPKSDYATAVRVTNVVAGVAPDGNWRQKLDEVCEALDKASVPFPALWRKREESEGWRDYPGRQQAIKAIQSRLELAKVRNEPSSETPPNFR
jgi:hypothetical protein